MGMEIVLTTLAHNLHPAANNIAARELNDSLATGHIRWFLVFESLITTFVHKAQSFGLVRYLFGKVNRNMMRGLIPIPSHRKNTATIKKGLVTQTNE